MVTPPRFSEKEVQEILANQYGISATVKSLVSYDDQNFHARDVNNGQEYVFKIYHAEEDYWYLDAQHQVMTLLAKATPAIPCQQTFSDKAGQAISRLDGKNGVTHLARLLSFLPGRFLVDVEDHSPELLSNIGKFMGTIDQHLAGFSHPAARRHYDWDLRNTLMVLPLTKFIRDPQRRTIAEYFYLQFETEALPELQTLRMSVIHNDGNDYNLLSDGKKISGIIDFGDLLYSNTICELAITLAYTLMGKADPLAAAATVIRGYHSVFPLQRREVDILFYLICARLCVSVSMSAKKITEDPENEYIRVSEKPAWDLLEKFIAINPEHAKAIFREACNMSPSQPKETSTALLKARKKHLGRNMSISYQKHLKINRGAMQYLFEENGETYLDCVNNVCHVGHCHPRVARAAQQQIARLNTNTRYLHDHLVEYARRLTATFPDPLSVCFFTCSGSEANDLALRLARNFTGQKDIVVVDGAYHGTTTSVIELSSYKFDGPGGKGAEAHIHKALMPDPYRGAYRSDDPQAGEKYAADVQRIIHEMADQGKQPAAFICESLLGCGGQIVLPPNYLKTAFQHIRKAGGLCIADEVQVGFGRVGSHFWAFEHQDVVPDIVTLGKPIGNGHPLAAVITTPEIADAFNNGMEYFNTFGGNPVSCAVGLAVLDAIEDDHLQENAQRTGTYFLEKLRELQARHPIIGDVRGLGLFIGAELVHDRETLTPAAETASMIIEEMRNRGILLSTDGPLHNVIKIKPPLVFSRDNVDQVIENLDEILNEL